MKTHAAVVTFAAHLVSLVQSETNRQLPLLTYPTRENQSSYHNPAAESLRAVKRRTIAIVHNGKQTAIAMMDRFLYSWVRCSLTAGGVPDMIRMVAWESVCRFQIKAGVCSCELLTKLVTIGYSMTTFISAWQHVPCQTLFFPRLCLEQV